METFHENDDSRALVWVRSYHGGICAIRADGATMCTGFDFGYFGGMQGGGPWQSISISIDGRSACGVTTAGQLKCFGNDSGDGFTRPGGNVSGPNASTDT